jgi:two-component system LytT family sensor kinase
MSSFHYNGFAVMDLAQSQRELLATLLVKVAIIAGIASVLARSGRFKKVLFRDARTPRECAELGAYIGIPVALVMIMRFRYALPDLGLEGALLAGVLGGYTSGLTAAALAALAAVISPYPMWLYPPILLAAGAVGGFARRLAPETEHIWHFSPFVDMNIYRWYQRRFGKPRGGWQLFFFLSISAVEAYTMILARFFPGSVSALHSPSKWMLVAIVGAGIICLAVPIKIWNNTRNELRLEEQNRLLVEARLLALTTQINPHFLFNTLNSASSLIRTDPEAARAVIHKLSTILRRLLRRSDAFSPLREELDLVDDYLSIERVRFGDKLRFVKRVDDGVLDAVVPSMLLQPLVENCIKHGIAPKVDGGTIEISSHRDDGRLRIEVRDDGVGIPGDRLAAIYDQGVGLNNVRERIKVLYGADYTFDVRSEAGQGTTIRIALPELAK